MGEALITRRGGGGMLEQIIDLPITISTVEPSAKRIGHLWISSNNKNKITKIEFNNELDPNPSNGTLQLIVPLITQQVNILQQLNVDGKNILASFKSNNSISKWPISNINTDGNISCQINLNGYPTVYSKIDDIFDIETAYIWTGSEWQIISENGRYVLFNDKIYNYDGINIILNTTLEYSFRCQMSRDARFVIAHDGNYNNNVIYIRIGNVFSKLDTVPSTFTFDNISYTIKKVLMSLSSRLVCLGESTNNGCAIKFYDCTNNGIVEVDTLKTGDFALKSSDNYRMMCINSDGTSVVFSSGSSSEPQSGNMYGTYLHFIKMNEQGIYQYYGYASNVIDSAGSSSSIYALESARYNYVGNTIHIKYQTSTKKYSVVYEPINYQTDFTLPYTDYSKTGQGIHIGNGLFIDIDRVGNGYPYNLYIYDTKIGTSYIVSISNLPSNLSTVSLSIYKEFSYDTNGIVYFKFLDSNSTIYLGAIQLTMSDGNVTSAQYLKTVVSDTSSTANMFYSLFEVSPSAIV